MSAHEINQLEIVAFFPDQSDALSAISELKEAGFTSDQIGLAVTGSRTPAERMTDRSSMASHASGEDHRSMWDKVKDFFSGEHEGYAGEGRDYENTFSHLPISADQSRYYSTGISAGGALVTVKAPPDRQAMAREILTRHDADLRTSGFDQPMGTGVQADRTANLDTSRIGTAQPGAGRLDTNQAERRIELRGELLRAVKQRVQTGEIRLRKDVVTENQTINVPVTREEVVVERVAADQAGRRPGASAPIGEGGEVRIPVSEERVSVTKEPVVTGEVRVQKRAVQDTEQVSDTVRHEEVRVENEGGVPVTDKTGTTTRKKKPAA